MNTQDKNMQRDSERKERTEAYKQQEGSANPQKAAAPQDKSKYASSQDQPKQK